MVRPSPFLEHYDNVNCITIKRWGEIRLVSASMIWAVIPVGLLQCKLCFLSNRERVGMANTLMESCKLRWLDETHRLPKWCINMKWLLVADLAWLYISLSRMAVMCIFTCTISCYNSMGMKGKDVFCFTGLKRELKALRFISCNLSETCLFASIWSSVWLVFN